MAVFLLINKVATLGLWLWALAGAYAFEVPYAHLGLPVSVFLLLAHIVETMVFLPRLRREGQSSMGHVLGILVFGVFHYLGARPQ